MTHGTRLTATQARQENDVDDAGRPVGLLWWAARGSKESRWPKSGRESRPHGKTGRARLRQAEIQEGKNKILFHFLNTFSNPI